MSKYAIKNVKGAEVSQAELSDDVFGIEPNIPVIHQVVVCQDSCARQGTHSVKNRHEVSGGGAKPYRQKGTGRARQGSTRAGQWTGGGVIFGPTPRTHNKRINNAHPAHPQQAHQQQDGQACHALRALRQGCRRRARARRQPLL